MAKKESKAYILEAINSIAKAQEALVSEVEKQGKEIERHEKILESHSKEITELQNKVTEMRDNAIIAELRFSSGKDVAEKYNLSPSRISQIKNRVN